MKEIRITFKDFSKQTKQKSKQNQAILKTIFTKKSTKQLQLHRTRNFLQHKT